MNCPKCGQPAISLGTINYIDAERSHNPRTPLYKCPTCVHYVPYPDVNDWPVEFVIFNGETRIVQPPADEFA